MRRHKQTFLRGFWWTMGRNFANLAFKLFGLR